MLHRFHPLRLLAVIGIPAGLFLFVYLMHLIGSNKTIMVWLGLNSTDMFLSFLIGILVTLMSIVLSMIIAMIVYGLIKLEQWIFE
jgi:hypothetical protein